MITKPCGEALERWLRLQNKFDGAIVETRGENGVFTITKWVVDGVAKPNDAQVMDIVDQYEATLENYNDDIFKTSLLNDETLASLAFQPFWSVVSEALRFQNWANLKVVLARVLGAGMVTQEQVDYFSAKLLSECNVNLSLY